ncbi:MAG: hypothetical protein LBM77_13435 [Spirochaetaceae bacterium]|nr:hypothetical protein [Spirochaetaceae bacterium]
MNRYCLFCETGKEIAVEDELKRHNLQVVESHKERLVWGTDGGKTKAARRFIPLIPGYIFIASDIEADAQFWKDITELPGVYYPLKYGDGTHALRGNDLKFVIWLENQSGLIRPVKAFKKGNRVIIIEGPLKEMGGTVLEINPKRKCAKIQLHGEGIQLSLWLQYELIDQIE